MKTAVITVTKEGSRLGQKIAAALQKLPGNQVDLYVPERFSGLCHGSLAYSPPLAPLIKRLFQERQAVVMVMALGIVIRLIAPYLQDKRTDPAVVVLDEKGKHVISALSGHLGGANELTAYLAAELEADPVITTATDVHNLPAVDLLAKQYKLVPESFTAVKEINAALVNGESVTVYTPYSLNLKTPGLEIRPWPDFKHRPANPDSRLVLITNDIILGLKNALFLRPRNLIAGLGCRKGTPLEQIKAALLQALSLAGKSISSIKLIATVDLRLNEPGLNALAGELGIPLIAFSRDEINAAFEKYPGIFEYSQFVKEKIGVGGVCEPVTLLASPQARLIRTKLRQSGVTVALAEEVWP